MTLPARLALFALRATHGPGPVAAAFAWATGAGAPSGALELAAERLRAGWGAPVGASVEWAPPPDPSTPPSGPAPSPDGGAAALAGQPGASLASGRLTGRPTTEDAAAVPPRPSKRHSRVAPSGPPTASTPAPGADPYLHLTTSLPASLVRAIAARSAALGVPRAVYLRGCVRAELEGAGWAVPAEPRPAARGRHARGPVNTGSKK